MSWLDFISDRLLFNSIIGIISSLIIGIVSSLVASVLDRHYRKQISSIVQRCQIRIGEYQRAIKKATETIFFAFSLRSQAILTSSETIRLVLLAVFVVVLLPLLSNLTFFITREDIQGKTNSHFGQWTYQVLKDKQEHESTLRLLRDGVDKYSVGSQFVDLVLFEPDGSTEVHSTYLEAGTQGELNTKDITGDKLPDVLLIVDCGCSAGFKDYHFLSLDTEVKEIFSVEAQKGLWRFDDLDGDQVPEIVTDEFIDDQFEESSGPYSALATVEIILKYENGTLRLASGLMKKPPPTEQEFLNKIAQDRRRLDSTERAEPDASYIAQLVFSGNGELARRYVNLLMAEEPENERGFYWSSIYGDMMGSSHWDEVAALNRWTSDEYAFKDCPY